MSLGILLARRTQKIHSMLPKFALVPSNLHIKKRPLGDSDSADLIYDPQALDLRTYVSSDNAMGPREFYDAVGEEGTTLRLL
jgi:hypothetical protein